MCLSNTKFVVCCFQLQSYISITVDILEKPAVVK